jgi:uncharacterized membrane protein YgdD (TMEM256/DUF423 family)
MFYQTLNTMIIVLVPMVIYITLFCMINAPDLVTTMPTSAHRAIELVGALLMVAGVFLFSGALAIIGLLLLITPIGARYINQFSLITTL